MELTNQIKKELVSAVLVAINKTADKREKFIKWPNNFKLNSAWGLGQTMNKDIIDILINLKYIQPLESIYNDRVADNNDTYNKKNNIKPNNHNNKHSDDDEYDDDDYLDNISVHDDVHHVTQKPEKTKYITNIASLYSLHSKIWWPSKRYGKFAMMSGVIIGKRPGAISDFLLVELPDGRPVTIDPTNTVIYKTLPTLKQRLLSTIMGESVKSLLQNK
jgi:hypothetical protein